MQASETRPTVTTAPAYSRGRLRVRRFALLAAVVSLGLGLTACGGGSNAAPSSSASSSAPKSVLAQGVRYAECMRSHGEPDFPDPNSQGGFEFSTSRSLNPSSTVFQTAEADCQSLKPAGNVSPAQESQEFTKVLKAAACIRQNGYPTFPDPTMSNGSIGLTLGNSNIDVNSPAFEKVAKNCDAPAGLLP